MRRACLLVLALLVGSSVRATYRPSASCQCNGKAAFCVLDHQGLRCVNCQANTEGRHCERCKPGFYQPWAGQGCMACNCSPSGSEAIGCNSAGRCLCKAGFSGDKCAQTSNSNSKLANGSIVKCSTQTRNLGNCLPCFCYGHSSDCSPANGYSVYNIASTFDSGSDGWRDSDAQCVTPSSAQFRWIQTNGDIEIVSRDIVPVYLLAPPKYLGNQVLSYGQTLSFSLRLDRGVRYPSPSDVVLEGAGLKVTAPLGDLRTVLPCGKRIIYTFRLDERPGSKWRPQLSSQQFQTLLSNLTAIKIRGTFGENSRGYVDNTNLVSARVGPGDPAGWVETCRCPAGYVGQFCESCAPGYRRRLPHNGPFSRCEPCLCRGGSCDPETGDCYSADETPSSGRCLSGSYHDPAQPARCLPCPCPLGNTCSLLPGTREVKCCPRGTTGVHCEHCDDGYYGDPLGQRGPRQACQPCRCNGHVNPKVQGSCNRQTGECVRCLNNTAGSSCERCLPGYYHGKPMEACRACGCSLLGSVSEACNDVGQCECKTGFEGRRCEQSGCPACFDPVKDEMQNFFYKLREMEDLLRGLDRASRPVNNAQLDRAVRTAEDVVADMQNKVVKLTESEMSLEQRLFDIWSAQLRENRDLQSISATVDQIRRRQQQYQKQISNLQGLISDIQQKLDKARRDLDLPLSDQVPDASSSFYDLEKKAVSLADEHQDKAANIQNTANSALAEAQKALNLMQSAMKEENAIRELVNNLKAEVETAASTAKALEEQAAGMKVVAMEESRTAAGTLDQIASLNISTPFMTDIAEVTATLNDVKDWMKNSLPELQAQQNATQNVKDAMESQLASGKAAKQITDQLLARANASTALADQAVKDINNTMSGLEDVLKKLKGAGDQLSPNITLAVEAIAKIPTINGTIQNATGTNAEIQNLLLGANKTYSATLANVSTLQDAVKQLETVSSSLPSISVLVQNASELNSNLKSLASQAANTNTRILTEKAKAEAQKDEVEKVAADASSAYRNANLTRDSVDETMKAVDYLLQTTGSSAPVDPTQVTKLQSAIDNARKRVTQELQPKLIELKQAEAIQKDTINRMIADINNMMEQINNLKEIQKTIPRGCYNSPPIERP
ncbi:laminin subunit gamma-1 [Denticeps clupeoides]|nr:laminin subunit gamma-1-like [Denticeps clupeoides]